VDIEGLKVKTNSISSFTESGPFDFSLQMEVTFLTPQKGVTAKNRAFLGGRKIALGG